MQGINSMGVGPRSIFWEHLHMEDDQIIVLQDSHTIANDGRDSENKTMACGFIAIYCKNTGQRISRGKASANLKRLDEEKHGSTFKPHHAVMEVGVLDHMQEQEYTFPTRQQPQINIDVQVVDNLHYDSSKDAEFPRDIFRPTILMSVFTNFVFPDGSRGIKTH